ncbi:hypothetical protein ATANTOWER_024656 [Ataeniobius toweri]|uniref:G-protein coupled receptors family 1 profile domain-containing protein n=1 Tax=Ataeniobius toweri TaxID=208326 RepID=A0ABU7BIH7_9TELE|nr:hypothetical protein [Ataeniobius toweri]
MSRLSQSLLLNLAISDQLCLLTLPPWIYSLLFGWKFDPVACKRLACLVYCSVYGRLLTVTGLSIRRYLVVVRQRRCHQVRRRMLLFMFWLTAVILSIPGLVNWNLQLCCFRVLAFTKRLARQPFSAINRQPNF